MIWVLAMSRLLQRAKGKNLFKEFGEIDIKRRGRRCEDWGGGCYWNVIIMKPILGF